MTKRLWFTTTTGRADGAWGVEVLTDEQALERFEKGEPIRPVENAKVLTQTLLEEAAA